MALDDFIARRYASGFVAPSYTFETDVTDDGANVAELKESVSREAVLSQVRVPRYDDRRYKFWCYDTPGLINPDQVGFRLDRYGNNTLPVHVFVVICDTSVL